MFVPVELGTALPQTAHGPGPLTISMLTTAGDTLHTLREHAAAAGQPVYRPVVITACVGEYHLDLGVRAENVDVTALPLDADRLADVEPITGMLADYRHRLTATAIRLATCGFVLNGRITAAFTVTDLRRLCHYLDQAEHHWREAATADQERPPTVSPRLSPRETVQPLVDRGPVAARHVGTELSRVRQFRRWFERLLVLSRPATDRQPRR